MPIVEMPDGALVQFPDDMPREQIKGLIASKYPDAAAGAKGSEKESNGVAGTSDPFMDSFYGGLGGAALGGAAGKISQAEQNRRRQREFIREAPTADELKTRSQGLYKSLDDSGIALSNESFGKFVDSLGARLADEGMDPQAHQKATAVFKRLQKEAASGSGQSLKNLNTLRQLAADVAGPGKMDASGRLGLIIRDAIDDYVSNGASEADVVARKGQESLDRVRGDTREARDLWRRKARTEKVDEEIGRGQLQAGGEEAGLRNRFRVILGSDRLKKGYSKAELAAMEDIVKGNFTDNALRFLGTQGLPVDQARKWLGPIGGGAMLAAGFDPLTAGATGAAATGANALLKNNANRNAEEVAAMVASGKDRPARIKGRGRMGALLGGLGGLGAGALLSGTAEAAEAPDGASEPRETAPEDEGAFAGGPPSYEEYQRIRAEQEPKLRAMHERKVAQMAEEVARDPNFVRGNIRSAMEAVGVPLEAREDVLAILENFTHAGTASMAEDAGRAVNEGDYGSAALLGGLAATGMFAPFAAKAGRRGLESLGFLSKLQRER